MGHHLIRHQFTHLRVVLPCTDIRWAGRAQHLLPVYFSGFIHETFTVTHKSSFTQSSIDIMNSYFSEMRAISIHLHFLLHLYQTKMFQQILTFLRDYLQTKTITTSSNKILCLSTCCSHIHHRRRSQSLHESLQSPNPLPEEPQQSFDIRTLRALAVLRHSPAVLGQRPPQTAYQEQFGLQSPLFPQ